MSGSPEGRAGAAPPRAPEPGMAMRCGQVREAILLALASLSPWAFGAVTAWAELALYFGVVLVALLGVAADRGPDRARALVRGPSLALLGLLALALVQASAWPGRLVARVTPGESAFRASLAPGLPDRVLGDPGPPVAPPGPELSECPELTADATIRLAAGWALLQAAAAAGRRPGALRRLGVALAVNSALLALFAVVQMLSWNGRLYWVLAELPEVARGGPFVNRNHLAAYLNLGLGFALAALIAPGRGDAREAERGRRLAAAYAAGLIIVGVLASFSRGGFVAMAAASAALLAFARPRASRVVGGLAAMLALAAAFLWGVGATDSYRRLATLSGPGALDGRLECWAVALRAWSSRPAWGLGLGTFAASAARFFDRDWPVVFQHAESEYLEALAEGGVIGLAIALALLATVLGAGLRAIRGAADAGRGVPVLGALFGLVAVAVHGLSDFPLHIPAIAVTVAILAGHLVGEGLDARGAGAGGAVGRWPGWAAGMLAALVPVAASLPGVWHGLEMARSEAALTVGGLPAFGTGVPTTTLWTAPAPRLERVRAALEEALRHRPGWAEGHARLGIVCLSQYRAEAMGLVGGQAGDTGRAEAMADPLWLHGVVHSASREQLEAAGGVLGDEAVRRHLVPAARSFLEARRCCPVWGLPHAELASLDYLLPGGESTSDHARRALATAGNDKPSIAMAARAAAQAGDLRLAAACWRRILLVGGEDGDVVADQARAVLTPRQILDWVLPDGRSALRLADRLYGAPEDRASRDLLLGWAAEQLPRDAGLPEAERLRLEALAQARLGRPGPARERMLAALALEPGRTAWRRELVEWLLGWGEVEQAHDQALIGLSLAPADPDARRAVELAAEALARGARRGPPGGPGEAGAPGLPDR